LDGSSLLHGTGVDGKQAKLTGVARLHGG